MLTDWKKRKRMDMKACLERMLRHEVMSRQEACQVMLSIAHRELPDVQIAALLTCLQMRGITVDELLGLRDGLLETGVPAPLRAERYIDIVGTGGDGKNTFNISTCACFVVAGAGYKVAKHGNTAATSVSGASNVMELHGVRFTNDVERLQRSLDGCGMVYLHAPLFARAMKEVAPVRRSITFPTVFNLLGPLVNPAQPKCNLLGVANLDQMRLYNSVFQRLGVDYAIEHSTQGYDEISLTGNFKVQTAAWERVFSPSDIGMPPARPEALSGGRTAQEAKAIFDAVLEGTAEPDQTNVVVANAALAIDVLERGARPLEECVALARESIESRRALGVLRRFVELNGD